MLDSKIRKSILIFAYSLTIDKNFIDLRFHAYKQVRIFRIFTIKYNFMKASKYLLANLILLSLIPGYAFSSSNIASLTAFIPTLLALITYLVGLKFSKNRRLLVKILLFLTIVGLFKPMISAIDNENIGALVRISIMIISTFCCLSYVLKKRYIYNN